MNARALLALFARSAREDTRSKALIWARIGIAGAVLFATARAQAFFGAGGAPGLAFFSSVVWMNFIFICLAGISYFASSITEEKEEGTLGLLRMTDLSPVAILLGKSTSRLLGGALLLLVQVPFALLAVTLGGVRSEQVFGCYALLGAFLFFACNVGLLGSVLSWRTGVAALVAAVVGIAYLWWPAVLAKASEISRIDELALTFCTPDVLEEVLDSRTQTVPLAWPLLALFGGGLAAFGLSWMLFERFCGEEVVTGRAARLAAGARSGGFGRPSRAWSDAVCWKDYYFLHGGTRGAAVKSFIYLGCALWLAMEMGGTSKRYMTGTIYFATLLGLSSGVVIMESLFATSRIYKLERKQKTFSGLVVLPAPFEELMKSKRRAIWVSLIPGSVFVVISSLAVLGPFLEGIDGTQFIWVAQGAGYLVAQLYFNHALVAWFSLRVKWGGLPLALGISWIGNSVSIFVATMMFQFAALIVMIIVLGFATAAMRSACRRQLEVAASED